MAGGPGTRLWPISRTGYPKQFLEVGKTGQSFIRRTYDRFAKFIPAENIIIVTAAKYRDIVLEQIPELAEAGPHALSIIAHRILFSRYKQDRKGPVHALKVLFLCQI